MLILSKGNRKAPLRARNIFAAILVTALLGVTLGTAGVEAGAELPTSSTTENQEAGAYIIDMGVSPQTIENGLMPFGLVYDLIINHQVPITWAIANGKMADPDGPGDIDLTVDGKDYRGGPFIIPAEFIIPQVVAAIDAWRAQGVVVDGPITTDFDIPRYEVVTAWPRTVLDEDNGSIAAEYYVNAGIPATSYRIDTQEGLTECDDLYAMPHADPVWSTHKNLVPFNEQGGYIWAACHAVSVLENVADPSDPNPDPDMNFLSNDGLIDFGDHDDGTSPYDYDATQGSDPIMQFIGRIDDATENGSEQIFLPEAAGWRPSTKVLVSDDDHPEVPSDSPGPAAKLAYGRGFGDPERGMVMYEGGHSHDGDSEDEVAAQRAFFNLHLLSGIERGIKVDVDAPANVGTGQTVDVTATLSSGSGVYDWDWISTCGGTFGQDSGSGITIDPVSEEAVVTTTFTAPPGAQDCAVKLTASDTCGHVAFGGIGTEIVELTDLRIDKTDAADPAESGATLTYTVTVTNDGPSTAVDVVVDDTLPAPVTFAVGRPDQGSCAYLGATLQCSLGDVADGASVDIEVDVVMDPTFEGSMTNTAVVTSDTPDTDPSNNQATEDTTVAINGLALTKSADPAFIDTPPAAVTFTFLATNTGPIELTNVGLVDDTCPGVTPVESGGFNAGDTDTDGAIDPGGAETWEYTCDLAAVSVDTTNTAAVEADHPVLGRISSPPATATVNVIAPDVAITKTAVSPSAATGGQAFFDITVENTGDTTLLDVTIADAKAPSCDRFFHQMAVGESRTWRCSLDVTIPAGTSDTNEVQVDAVDPSGETVSDTGSAPYSAVTSALAITKTNDATGPLAPGDQVTYTINVTNNGSTTQDDVVVSDAFPPAFTWLESTVERQTGSELAREDWYRDVHKDTYSGGWGEWNDDGKPTGSDIRGEAGFLHLKKDDKGAFKAIDLSSATSVTVDFDWSTLKSESGSPGTFQVAAWNGTSWVTLGSPFTLDAAYPTAHPGQSVSVALPAGTNIAGGRIGFITGATNTGNDEVQIDDVTITWDDGSFSDDFWFDTELYHAGWEEIGETTRRSTDDIRVVNDSDGSDCDVNTDCVLRLKKKDHGIFLPLDLSGGSSVTVDFDYRAVNVDKVGSNFDLVAWNGTSWVIVGNYAIDGGPGTMTTQPTVTISDPALLIAGGRIGFLMPSLPDGSDEVHIDNIVIGGTTDQSTTYLAATSPSRGTDPVIAADDIDLAPGQSVTITQIAEIDPGLTPFYSREQLNTAATSSVQQPSPIQAGSQVEVVVPGLGIAKTADPEFSGSGDPVTYTMEVINTGNDPLSNVTVADPDCGPITGPTGDTNGDTKLDLTEAWEYTCSANPTADITNTATVDADDFFGNPVPQASDTASVDIVDATIDVVKATSTPVIRPGDTAFYTYDVTNGTSTERLLGTFVIDDLCAPVLPVQTGSINVGDTNSDGYVDEGETWQFGCDTVLDGTGSGPDGTVTNTATATGSDRLGADIVATDTTDVRVIEPGISLVKTALTNDVPVGATVTFQLDVTNTGNDPLTGVAVTDPQCGPLSGPAGDGGTPGVLDIGEAWTYTCEVTASTDVTNTAVASGSDTLGGTVSDTDTEDLNVLGAGISVGKTGDVAAQYLGDDVVFQVTIFNSGDTNFDEADVIITDPACPGLTRVRPGDAGFPAGWPDDGDAVLAAGESWLYTCTLAVPTDVSQLTDGSLVNTVDVSATDTLGQVVADDDDHKVAALDPGLAVTKTPDTASAVPGTDVTYTYEVANTSQIPTVQNGVNLDSITDDKCTTVDPVLNPGTGKNVGDLDGDGQIGFDETTGDSEVWQFTCTATLGSTTTNTATVDGTDTQGNDVDDATAQATVIVGDTEITLEKRAGDAADGDIEYLDAAATVTYTYVITNSGDIDLSVSSFVDDAGTPTDPSDDIDLAAICPLPDPLAPGASTTCTTDIAISADTTNLASIDADPVTAAGDPIAGLPSTQDTDGAEVAIVSPDLSVVKTAGNAADGDTEHIESAGSVTYTYEVTNTGNTSLSAVTITDDAGTPADPSDDIDATAGCTIPDPLAPGASVTCTQSITVSGDVTNTADASANPVDGGGADLPGISDATASDDADVDLVAPGIAVVKTAGTAADGDPSYLAAPGGAVTYTYDITNTGDTSLVDIAVVDDVGTPAATGDDVTVCTIAGPLTAGDSATCTTDLPVTSDRTNIATAGATPADTGGTPLPDISDVSATDDALVDVVTPSVELVKTAGNAADGDVLYVDGTTLVTYDYAVANTGDTHLADITIVDDMGTPADTSDDSTVCTVAGPVAPGDSTTCTADVSVTDDVVNIAIVAATPSDAAGDVLPGVADVAAVDTAAVDVVDPSVQVIKTAGNATDGTFEYVNEPGGTVTYTYEITNTGDTSLVNIDIVDDLGTPGDATDDLAVCTVAGPLAPGESASCSADILVTADVSNTATASGTPSTGSGTPLPGIDPTTDTDMATVMVVDPSVQVVKTAGNAADGDTEFVTAPGGTVTYSYEITNTGDTSLVEVVVVDDMGTPTDNSDDVTVCTVAGPLVPAGSTTCTQDVAVSANVVNQARVTANPSTTAGSDLDDIADVSDTDTAAVVLVSPGLSVEKTAGNAADGEIEYLDADGSLSVLYDYVITNTGDTHLIDVQATDDLGTPGDASDDVTVCTIAGPLDPGDSQTCQLSVTVIDDVTNIATASGTPATAAGTALPDIPDVSGTDDAVVDVVDPAVTVVKTAGAAADGDTAFIPAPGGTVTYAYIVTNTGDTHLSGLAVTDDAGTPVDPSDDVDVTAGCTVTEPLAPGDSFTCTVDLAISADRTNVAQATGTPSDASGTDLADIADVSATDTADVDVVDPTLEITKTAGNAADGAVEFLAAPGGTVTYTYDATNSGDTHLSDIEIVDDAGTPADTTDDITVCTVTGPLAPGDTDSCTTDIAVSADITNIATGTGNPTTVGGTDLPGVPDAQSSDDATVDVVDPSIQVVKTAGNAADGAVEYIDGAATVTYSYAVTNTGDTHLTDISIVDDAGTPTDTTDDITVCTMAGPLAPGDTDTCTANISVTADVTNTATAIANPTTSSGTDLPDIDDATDTDTATVDVVDPSIQVTKTAGNAADGAVEYIDGAATVTYSYAVTNTGDTHLTDITITDDAGTPTDTTDDITVCTVTGPLAPGDTDTCTANISVNADVTNTATAIANPTTAVGADLADIVDVTDGDIAMVDVVDPSIQVTKTAGNAADGAVEYIDGAATVTYSYAVTNTGDTHLSDIEVTDDAGTPGGTTDDITVCTVTGPLAPGDTTTCTTGIAITSDVTNTATVTANPTNGLGADLPDIDDPSATDTADVDVINPTVEIVKTAGNTADGEVEYIDGAATVTYSYAVTNTGDTHLTDITITDDAGTPADTTDDITVCTITGPLAPADTDTCTADISVSVDTTNTATATANPTNGFGIDLPDIGNTTDTDTAAVDVVDPSVSVIKTAGNAADGDTEYIDGAATVTYSYAVTNTGDTFLSDIDVTDDAGTPGGTPADTADDIAVCTIGGPLAPGDTDTCTTDLPVADDTTNTATAIANPTNAAGDDVPDIDDATDTDNADVDVVDPSISVVKTAGNAADGEIEYIDGAATVTYSYAVTNTGDTHLSDIDVTDDAGTPGDTTDDITVCTVTGPLAPGDTDTCTTDLPISVDTTNTAIATANPTNGFGIDLPDIDEATDTDDAVVDVVDPSISVVKTAGNGTDGAVEYIDGTATVTYSYAVTNTGDTHLSDIDVVDDAGTPTDITDDIAVCTIGGPLAPGDTDTCTEDISVTADVTNIATATANPTNGFGIDLPDIGNTTDTDDAVVDVVDPSIQVVKTAGNATDGDTEYIDGAATVTYSYAVTNTGDTHLSDITIVDDAGTPGDTTDDIAVCTITGPLAPGDTTTCTEDISVTADVTNTATATANPTTSSGTDLPDIDDVTDTDTAVVDVINPTVEVVKTAGNAADDEVEHIDGAATVTYSYAVTNTGDTHLADISIVDDAGTLADATDDIAVCTITGPLAPGDTDTCTTDLTISVDTTNTAIATANPTNGFGIDVPDINDATDTDTATVDVVDPSIQVVKTAGNAADGAVEYIDGAATVTYSYAVTNTGDTHLTDITITDDAGTTADTADDIAVCTITGPLAPGDTTTCTTDLAVTADVTNTATTTGNPTNAVGDDLADISDVADTDIAVVDVVAPGLTIVKTAGSAADGDTEFINGPGLVTYRYEVTNTGDTHLSDIDVVDDAGTPTDITDDIAVCTVAGPLAPGDSSSCTTDLTISVDTTNTATATGNPTNGFGADLADIADASDTDTAAVDVLGPSIQVTKTAGDAGDGQVEYIDGAATVTYTYAVTNTGDAHLSDITITDDAGTPTDATDDITVCTVAGPLAPGANTTCSTDLPVGADVTNTTTVTGNPTDAGAVDLPGVADVTDTDDAVVDVVNPSIQVVKSAGNAVSGSIEYIDGAATVTYTYAVTNTGDTHLSDIDVVDDAGTPADTTDDITVCTVAGPLAPGDTTTCTTDLAVTADVINMTTATANPTTSSGIDLPDIDDATDTDTAAVDVVDPSIQVVKTAGNAADGQVEYIDGAATVTYSYAVTNTGDTHLTDIDITDDAGTPTDATDDITVCTITGPLAPADSSSCTTDLPITADVTNTAIVTANPTNAAGTDLPDIDDATDTDTAAVDVVNPSIQVVKSAGNAADGDAEYIDGAATVTYTYAVTNTGDTHLADITIVDDAGTLADATDDIAVCTITGPLAPGDTDTCTTDIAVTADVINMTTATANPTNGFGIDLPDIDDVTDTDTAAVDVINPTVEIVKTAGNAADGQVEYIDGTATVTYTYAVTNTGDTHLADITITDDAGTPGGTPADTADDITVCTITGPLAPGDTDTCTTDLPVADDTTNTATAIANPTNAAGDDVPDIDDATDTDDAVVDVVDPSISVVKTAGNAADGEIEYIEGAATVTYSYAVTNTGDTHLSDIDVTDDAGTPADTTDDITVCTVTGPLAPRDTDTCTEDISLTADVTNIATATANPTNGFGTDLPDIDEATDTDTAVVDVINPTVEVVKTAGNAADGAVEYTDGTATVTYSYAVTNTGDTFLSDIDVTDDAGTPGGTPADTADDIAVCTIGGPLAPGDTDTCTEDISVTADVTNIATATANPTNGFGIDLPDIDEATDTDTADVDVVDPSISVVKTAGNAADGEVEYIDGAATVTYTYDIANTGDTHLSDIELTDDAGTPGDTTDDITVCTVTGPLAPSDTTTCTEDISVTADVTNMATVTANPTGGLGFDVPDIDDVTDTDTAVVDVINPTVEVVKTAGNAADGAVEYTDGTATVTYSYAVTNTGDTFLSDIDVTDDVGTPADTTDDITVCTVTGPLAPGDTDTCTTDLPISVDTTNTATATANPTNGFGIDLPDIDEATDTDTADVDVVDPSISVVKTAGNGTDGAVEYIDGAATVTYSYAVTNTGDTHLSDITIVDDAGTPGDTTDDIAVCTITGPLAPSDTTTCTEDISVTADVTNTATATANPTTSSGTDLPDIDDVTDTDTAVVDVINPTVEVVKTAGNAADDEVEHIDGAATVTYSYAVTNTGDTHLADISIVDDAGTLADATDDIAVCTITGPLAPGDTDTCTTDLTISVDTTNTAIATANPTNGFGIDVPDINDATDTDTATVDVVDPSIQVVKTAGNAADGAVEYIDGAATVTYSYAVTNTGDTHLTDITITDDAGTTADTADDIAVCTITGPLAPGDTTTCTTDLAVTADVTNTATTTGNPTNAVGDDLADISDVADTDIAVVDVVAPGLTIVKTAGSAADGDTEFINGPGLVTYRYEVTNTGDTHLSDIDVVDDAGTPTDITDDIAVCTVAGPLAPGDSSSCTTDLTISVDTTNTATATGNPTNGFGADLADIADASDTDTAAVDVLGPSIQVTKTAGDAGDGQVEYIDGAATVTYTYAVTNTGDAHLSDITITDDAGTPTDATDDITVCTVAGPLAPGANTTCSTDLPVGADVTNTATVTGNPTDAGAVDLPGVADVTDTDDAVVDVVNPSIQVVKSAGNAVSGSIEYIDGAATVTYTYAVTNTGDTHLSDIDVVDDAGTPADTTDDITVCTVAGPLAPGDTTTCTTDLAVTADVINMTTATANPTTSSGIDLPDIDDATDTDTAAVDVVDPSIQVAKTAGNAVDGDTEYIDGAATVTYSYAVTNTGDTHLTDIDITDDAGTPGDTTDDITVCTITGPLAPADSSSCTADIPVTADVTNTATVTGNPATSSATDLPDIDNATATDTAAVDVVNPSIQVVKSAGNAADGDAEYIDGAATVTYTYAVTNTGDTHLADITIVDDAGTLADATDDIAVCTITGPLAPGDTDTCTTDIAVTADVINMTTATANPTNGFGIDLPDIDDVTDTDTAAVDVINPTVEIVKTAGNAADGQVEYIDGTATVTYTYAVTNTGDTHLADITITDDAGTPGGTPADTADDITVCTITGPLAPADSSSCTADISVTADVTNTATVTGNPATSSGTDLPDIDDVTDTDTATVDVVGPSIQVVKSAGNAADGEVEYIDGASTVTYSYAVTNTGDTHLSDIDVTDDAGTPGDTTDDIAVCTITGPLAPGDTDTCTTDLTISVDTTNTAIATANPTGGLGFDVPDIDDVTDTDTAVVDVVDPSISVTKTAGNAADGEVEYTDGAATVTYSYAVTNTGDTFLSDITIVDDAGTSTDTTDDIAVCTITGPLAPVDSSSCTTNLTVTDDTTNTATATANPTNGFGIDVPDIDDVTDTDTAAVDVISPSVSVTKTAGNAADGEVEYTDGAATVTYTYDIANTGDTFLSDITITDDAGTPTDTTDDITICTITGPLAPSDTDTCTTDLPITDDTTNTATATANPTNGFGIDLPDIGNTTDTDTAAVDVVDPSVSVIKTAGNAADGDTEYTDGAATVTYTYDIANTGDTFLSDITITDDAGTPTDTTDDITICTITGPLAPSDTDTCTTDLPITDDTTNTATATANPTNGFGIDLPDIGNTTDTDTAAVDVVDPSVSVIKTAGNAADGDTEYTDGAATVTYTYDIANTGDTFLSDITIADDAGTPTDTNDDITICTITGPLAPSDTDTCTTDLPITDDTTNTATATANPTNASGDDLPDIDDATDTDTADVDVVNPSISLAKTVYAGHDAGASCTGAELLRAGAGAPVTYCFLVTNTGDTHLADIEITDASLDIPGSRSASSLGADSDPLAPGDSAAFFVETAVDGDLENEAQASASPVDSRGNALPDIDDPTSPVDEAIVDEVRPAIEVEKTAYVGHDAGSGCPGDDVVAGSAGMQITYCVVIENAGDTHLAALAVNDAALGLSLIEFTVAEGDPDVPLPPGDRIVLYVESSVAGRLTNTVEVSAQPTNGAGTSVPGAVPVEADDTADVVESPTAVDLVKSVYDGHDSGVGCSGVAATVVATGHDITFCFLITNTSEAPVHLDAIALSDPALGITEADLAVARGTTPLEPGAELVLYVETTAEAEITNIADMTAQPSDPAGTPLPGVDPVGDDGDAFVGVLQPEIELEKSVDPADVSPGEVVTFTLVVTNPGKVPITDVLLTDDQCSGLGEPVKAAGDGDDMLEPGEEWTSTCTATVTGDVTNTASVTGTAICPVATLGCTQGEPLAGGEVEASDSVDVNVIDVDLQLVKELSGELEPDGTGTYVLTVENAGPDDATQVELRDPLPDGLTFVSATGGEWTCSSDDGELVVCERDRLDVGETSTLTLQVAVDATVDGTVENTASVTSQEDERDLSNNSDSALTTISSQSQPPPAAPPAPPTPPAPAAPPTFLASTGAKVGGILLLGLGLGIVGVLFLTASNRRREDSID